MQTILKVFSVFIGIFIIANGTWVVVMPPYGDEAFGVAVIAVGLAIPALTLYVAAERRGIRSLIPAVKIKENDQLYDRNGTYAS